MDNFEDGIEKDLKDLEKTNKNTNTTSSKNIIYSFETKEFPEYERSVRWYISLLVIGLLLIIYAIFSQSYMMFLSFILIIALILILANKEPRNIIVKITNSGIILNDEIVYLYDDIDTFGVFVSPPNSYLSLYMRDGFTPYNKVPLGKENPEDIANIIEKFISREDGKENIFHKLDNILKL